MTEHPDFIEISTGQRYIPAPERWQGESGGTLRVEGAAGLTAPRAGLRGPWRYLPSVLGAERPVTLGEGGTALFPIRVDAAELLIKAEWTNPTGSYKDRGTAAMMSFFRAQGVTEIAVDSSGNAGASIAAYAAAAGIAARIYVPQHSAGAKAAQIEAYGATLVRGENRAELAASARGGAAVYASHQWQPLFLHGMKTLAYELWEDLGGAAPGAVIAPCGSGTIILGLFLGFSELLQAGAIARMPRLYAVQPERCAPVARAFLDGFDAACPVSSTVAEGTAVQHPPRLHEILGALAGSEGGAVMIQEADIIAATHHLARRGLLVEPTSAQVLPAWHKLRASGAIPDGMDTAPEQRPEQRTVLILSGAGLKTLPLPR